MLVPEALPDTTRLGCQDGLPSKRPGVVDLGSMYSKYGSPRHGVWVGLMFKEKRE